MWSKHIMPSSPSNLVLSLFFILAIGSWWLRQIVDERISEPDLGTHHAPDYWITRLSAKTMDSQGRLRRVMNAEGLQHFPDDDSAELSKPQIDFIDPSAPPWKVQAENGWVAADGQLILLKGVVTLDREADKETATKFASTHLTTKDMRVRPKDEYAETDQPVQMQSGKSHIESVGLKVWFKRPARMILPAKVHAHYEVSK